MSTIAAVSKEPRSPLVRLTIAGTLLAMLAACSGQEVYTDLNERQANEMVAVLQGAGISAKKTSRDGHFAIVTSEREFGAAVRTLNAEGYPREAFDTIGQVFKREGFVSSPLEERARLLHAMSQEMSNTLAHIDGVVTARVHLVVPEHSPLADKAQPSAASVFIKHRPDRDLAAQIPQIKAMVVNSIEGLVYANVTVALFAADKPKIEQPVATAVSAAVVPMVAGGTTSILALLGSAVFWLRSRRRPRPDGTVPRLGHETEPSLDGRSNP